MWGEVHGGEKWIVSASAVKDFPKLDAEKQDLAQMKQAKGVLMVGVRDNDDGKFQSGWVAIDTGVSKNRTEIIHTGICTPDTESTAWTPIRATRHICIFTTTSTWRTTRKTGFWHDPKDLIAKPAKDCEPSLPAAAVTLRWQP